MANWKDKNQQLLGPSTWCYDNPNSFGKCALGSLREDMNGGRVEGFTGGGNSMSFFGAQRWKKAGHTWGRECLLSP